MICYERKYYEEYDNTILLTFMIYKGDIVEEKYQTQKEMVYVEVNWIEIGTDKIFMGYIKKEF